MTEYEFLSKVFDYLTAGVKAQFDQLKTEVKVTLMALNEELRSMRDTLASNTAVIQDIAGDIDELKATNGDLAAKVDELLANQPDNPLLAEVKSLVDAQASTLRQVADKVPEPPPVPPPTPA